MTKKELRKSLELRKSRIDDPDFSRLPSEIEIEMIIAGASIVALGALLAVVVICIFRDFLIVQ